MEDTVTEEYADNQAARGGRNRRRGMTTFRVKTVGWLFVLLATIGTTILPSMLGYQPGSDDMVAMTVLVICEVVSWTAVPLYAWLLVQGYRHTHSVVQYGIRLLALAIISEVPYDMATSGKVWDMNSQNPVFALMIATAVIAIITVISFSRLKRKGIKRFETL